VTRWHRAEVIRAEARWQVERGALAGASPDELRRMTAAQWGALGEELALAGARGRQAWPSLADVSAWEAEAGRILDAGRRDS